MCSKNENRSINLDKSFSTMCLKHVASAIELAY